MLSGIARPDVKPKDLKAGSGANLYESPKARSKWFLSKRKT